jgi:hypothetical protein
MDERAPIFGVPVAGGDGRWLAAPALTGDPRRSNRQVGPDLPAGDLLGNALVLLRQCSRVGGWSEGGTVVW